jgi:hypothetical protein
METFELNKLFDLVSDSTARQESKTLRSWDDGFAFFERQVARGAMSEDEKKRLRNSLQDRIIAASNQRCGEYKDFLKRFDSESNILLGWLGTATAGAGAILTPVNTVRTLSGIAAILSGWRAEVNEAYFNKLTIQVITSGIEGKRKEVLTAIINRQKETLLTYSLPGAVGDAAMYHYNCSLIAGLEHAGQSIERAENPGLKVISDSLDSLKQIQDKASALVQKPAPSQ